MDSADGQGSSLPATGGVGRGAESVCAEAEGTSEPIDSAPSKSTKLLCGCCGRERSGWLCVSCVGGRGWEAKAAKLCRARSQLAQARAAASQGLEERLGEHSRLSHAALSTARSLAEKRRCVQLRRDLIAEKTRRLKDIREQRLVLAASSADLSKAAENQADQLQRREKRREDLVSRLEKAQVSLAEVRTRRVRELMEEVLTMAPLPESKTGSETKAALLAATRTNFVDGRWTVSQQGGRESFVLSGVEVEEGWAREDLVRAANAAFGGPRAAFCPALGPSALLVRCLALLLDSPLWESLPLLPAFTALELSAAQLQTLIFQLTANSVCLARRLQLGSVDPRRPLRCLLSVSQAAVPRDLHAAAVRVPRPTADALDRLAPTHWAEKSADGPEPPSPEVEELWEEISPLSLPPKAQLGEQIDPRRSTLGSLFSVATTSVQGLFRGPSSS